MGASVPAKRSDAQTVLLNKMELVRSIVEELKVEGTLPLHYSYEQFCEELDLGDIYTKRLIELLVKETFNRSREDEAGSALSSSLPLSSRSMAEGYVASSQIPSGPNGLGSSKWYQAPRDHRRESFGADSLVGMDVQELDGLRVVDSWDQ